jgi:hypothetical protein
VLVWTVLALVLVCELAAVAAAAVGGTAIAGPVAGVLAGILVIAVWALFASPKARFGGPVLRPVVKVAVFALTSAGLGVAGHPWWGVALFACSAVVHGLALLPPVRRQAEAVTG